MKGIGISHGAVSVLNAIPCGIGSTIGIGLETKATFETSKNIDIELIDRPNVRTDLASTCVKRTLEYIGTETNGYHLTVETDIPPSMGLKSSSSVCNAVISSVLDAYGMKMDAMDKIRLGVMCAIENHVTITGAIDDACGCELGGLVVTDNTKNELLFKKEIPSYDVVICVADRTITKNKVPVEKYKSLSDEYRQLVPMIKDDYLSVLTKNGRFVSEIIGDAGTIAEKALENGALAAGITGTGPAVAVIAEKGDGKHLSEVLGGNTILTETR